MEELLGDNESLSLEDFLVWTVKAHLPQVVISDTTHLPQIVLSDKAHLPQVLLSYSAHLPQGYSLFTIGSYL